MLEGITTLARSAMLAGSIAFMSFLFVSATIQGVVMMPILFPLVTAFPAMVMVPVSIAISLTIHVFITCPVLGIPISVNKSLH